MTIFGKCSEAEHLTFVAALKSRLINIVLVVVEFCFVLFCFALFCLFCFVLFCFVNYTIKGFGAAFMGKKVRKSESIPISCL